MLAAIAVLRPRFSLRRGDAATLAGIGGLDITGNLLFALASARGLVSVVSVLAALYPITTVALARILLQERPARIQAAGVALALTGVALIAAG